MQIEELIKNLRSESVHTWFDLGLFIDRVKENRKVPGVEFKGSFRQFKNELGKGGIAFIPFHYAVDGVTVEIDKYAKSFRSIFKGITIHYIAGEIMPEANRFIHPSVKQFELKEIDGFDNWDLYKDFFFTKLQRGSDTYNELITKFWKQTLDITEKLGSYIERNNIKLLYLVNTNSNPGNVCLALSTVLVSEYLGIPVINNCHDYYWEGGNRKIDIKTKGLKPGPRDFFFRNSHLGEFFSQIEVLYPWQSRTWMTVNINKNQTDHVISKFGQNPANVCEIGTAVDTNEYRVRTKRNKINAFIQVAGMLSNYKKKLRVNTVSDILSKKKFDYHDPKPILVGYKRRSTFDFINNNIVFLQPTRLMPRKRIEVAYNLVERLAEHEEFLIKLRNNPDLSITILITGPIPLGQYDYFTKLLKEFQECLRLLKPWLRERVFLGFLFSEFDKKRFTNKCTHPIDIPELYNIASLILLPSETEGRGLPIIEATACGIPIFCRRYYPENVYAEVIGEHLSEKERLKVLEYDGRKIRDKLVDDIFQRVFFPHEFMEEVEHNHKVVYKRYSLDSLKINIEKILQQLYWQMKSNELSSKFTASQTKEYSKIVSFSNSDLEYIINSNKRQYLPGSGQLYFMLLLKSLIDPSFFRVEEQLIRGLIMQFARKLVDTALNTMEITPEKLIYFFNCVDNIFSYSKGEAETRHDHSFAYRHRNRKHYPYQQFTHQELTGLVNMLFNKIVKPKAPTSFERTPHFFTDWSLALLQLTNSYHLGIDDRPLLTKKLRQNVPIAYFPGEYIKYELEFFVLQPIRARLGLQIQEELKEEHLIKQADKIAKVYIICLNHPLGKWLTATSLEKYLKTTDDSELSLLYKYKICRVVKSEQLCMGIHFPQMGVRALKVLRQIKEKNGFIIANGDNAPVMTDIVDIDRFHIGKVKKEVSSRLMGIPINSGFVQYVPAGIRFALAYPTPMQNGKDVSNVLHGPLFKKLSKKYGESKLLKMIAREADEQGAPIAVTLNNIDNKDKPTKEKAVEYSYVNGLYEDGLPWSGAVAKVKVKKVSKGWKFATYSTKGKTKPVTDFVNAFDKGRVNKAQIAWNGGYILNPELVGKLGLPESYIGSPLGLLISKKKIICPPLFNKPAFLIYPDGKIDIKLVSSREGFTASAEGKKLVFNADSYNNHNSKPCFYDLLYKHESIKGDGNVIVRLAGNVIKEVIFTKKNQEVKMIPVGITLSLPKHLFPKKWNTLEKKLDIKMTGWEEIDHAVEAGPLLIEHGKNAIDMRKEGWKTQTSINTQAARLDFTDMRGPKIAVGLDKNGNLCVLTINGRIRESVGATHIDMAEILMSMGIQKAMGFDPGGSSTLVVNGKTLNISPYNQNYEMDIYSLPPQPRAVSNVVIGWQE